MCLCVCHMCVSACVCLSVLQGYIETANSTSECSVSQAFASVHDTILYTNFNKIIIIMSLALTIYFYHEDFTHRC